jgi:hypothetical protein
MRFEKGDKVIAIDNTGTGGYRVGIFIDYNYFDGKAPDGITRFKDANGKEWFNALLVQYSEPLALYLDGMIPENQYMYCVNILRNK